MKVLYHAADLLWASRLASAARSAGATAIALKDEASAAQTLDDLDGDTALILVDLASPAALAVIRALDARRRSAGCAAEVRIVAFGPHVDQAALDEAQGAGADEALPRGALVKRLEAMLKSNVRPD